MLEIITLLLLQAATLFGTPITAESAATTSAETTTHDGTPPANPPLQIGDSGWGHD
ncbi:hypothetical protein [Hymenobacter arizonensis]|uniref:Uncharacterized protein n=1 Tax=Hymenobacter arizonensis TaxID=1227077 RepID=A0A1I6BFZ3_HYMAR|nr:hypothetical protein [Hymenobacter arizonensis]SFQ79826.1 hypothetical protein SAMN04515668_4505 [Hymenobacter arizonensis]